MDKVLVMDVVRVKVPVLVAAPVMEAVPVTGRGMDKARVMGAVTGSATPQGIAARVSKKM